jgi:hypothetical protein
MAAIIKDGLKSTSPVPDCGKEIRISTEVRLGCLNCSVRDTKHARPTTDVTAASRALRGMFISPTDQFPCDLRRQLAEHASVLCYSVLPVTTSLSTLRRE